MYRIMYRFLVPGWSAKPLVSAHDRIMGTHRLHPLKCRDPAQHSVWLTQMTEVNELYRVCVR